MKLPESNDFSRIGAPAMRALGSVGVRNLKDLTRFSAKELLAMHGFGPKALSLLQQRLREAGLSLSE